MFRPRLRRRSPALLRHRRLAPAWSTLRVGLHSPPGADYDSEGGARRISTDPAKLGHRGIDSGGDPGKGAGAAQGLPYTGQKVAPAAVVSPPGLEPWEMPPAGVGDGARPAATASFPLMGRPTEDARRRRASMPTQAMRAERRRDAQSLHERRQYDAYDPERWGGVVPYTADEVGDIPAEYFGYQIAMERAGASAEETPVPGSLRRYAYYADLAVASACRD